MLAVPTGLYFVSLYVTHVLIAGHGFGECLRGVMLGYVMFMPLAVVLLLAMCVVASSLQEVKEPVRKLMRIVSIAILPGIIWLVNSLYNWLVQNGLSSMDTGWALYPVCACQLAMGISIGLSES